jgi:hypothetical protein
MTKEERRQHDEWQSQLKQQDEEEKERKRIQREREENLMNSGWKSMGVIEVGDHVERDYGERRNGK